MASLPALYSDGLQLYVGFEEIYVHRVIDHAVNYMDGLENIKTRRLVSCVPSSGRS